MTRSTLRIAIVTALVVGASVAIFFGLVTRDGTAARCTGCRYSAGPTGTGGFPATIAVAKVAIPKGTSGSAIGDKMVSWKDVPRSDPSAGTSVDPRRLRGEITIRTIPAGTVLTAADFALRGPIYYPSGYPKSVPASQVPAEFVKSNYLPAQSFPSDLEVAPGVYVDGQPSAATTDLHVANGMLIGYCGPVRSFKAHNPRVPFTSKCWHYRR